MKPAKTFVLFVVFMAAAWAQAGIIDLKVVHELGVKGFFVERSDSGVTICASNFDGNGQYLGMALYVAGKRIMSRKVEDYSCRSEDLVRTETAESMKHTFNVSEEEMLRAWIEVSYGVSNTDGVPTERHFIVPCYHF